MSSESNYADRLKLLFDDGTYTETERFVGASGKRGAFCAIQTLRQLVMLCGASVPLCRIEDSADYADRGFYHDVTRGRVPKLETLKALVDELALY